VERASVLIKAERLSACRSIFRGGSVLEPAPEFKIRVEEQKIMAYSLSWGSLSDLCAQPLDRMLILTQE
jgi:hypothetical protein